MKPKSPIFIIGCPRSGTTLLGLMLDSHPSISIAHEAGIFHFLYHHSGKQRWKFSSTVDRKIFFEKLEHNSNLQEAFGQDVICTATRELQAAERLTEKLIIDSLFAAYLRESGKTIWGEKTPTYYYHISDILSLYPQAAIICIIRDPRAVFASMKRYARYKEGQMGHWWMTENLDEASMLWLDSYESAMKWKSKIFSVKYEELVQSPEAVLRDLTQHYLNIPYNPAMLKYYEKTEDKIVNIPEWHKAATHRVNPANAYRWRSELTSDEISQVESILHEQMKQLGYELESNCLKNTEHFKVTIKRSIYIVKRNINKSLKFTAWQIFRFLKKIFMIIR